MHLSDIALAVADRKPVMPPADAHTRKAAVAAILREVAAGIEVLLIRRAEREGDPWSGHMAFPGGHCDAGDINLAHTAIRETKEEIGLDLKTCGRLLGPLDISRPTLARDRLNIMVASYVFAVQGEHEFQLSHEVDEAIWTPLNDMIEGKLHTVYQPIWSHATDGWPGFDLDGRIIWGLTYRMLGTLFDLLQLDWRP